MSLSEFLRVGGQAAGVGADVLHGADIDRRTTLAELLAAGERKRQEQNDAVLNALRGAQTSETYARASSLATPTEPVRYMTDASGNIVGLPTRVPRSSPSVGGLGQFGGSFVPADESVPDMRSGGGLGSLGTTGDQTARNQAPASMQPTPGRPLLASERPNAVVNAIRGNAGGGAGPGSSSATGSPAQGQSPPDVRPIATGVRALVRAPSPASEPVRTQQLPDGRRMVTQRGPTGDWAPAMTATGDTVFAPTPSRAAAGGRSPASQQASALSTLHAQITDTDRQLAVLRKQAAAADDQFAVPEVRAAGQQAKAQLSAMQGRRDSLVAVRDRLAAQQQSALPGAGGSPVQHRSAPPAAPSVAPLSDSDRQRAQTDPGFQKWLISRGYTPDAWKP